MRSLRHLHPHPPHPNRCQQLRQLLQEPPVEERGGLQEAGASSEEEGDGDTDEGQPTQHPHRARHPNQV